MQKTRSTLLVILMMTAALAGCISEDTSDLDTQIEDLDTQNTELTQTCLLYTSDAADDC